MQIRFLVAPNNRNVISLRRTAYFEHVAFGNDRAVLLPGEPDWEAHPDTQPQTTNLGVLAAAVIYADDRPSWPVVALGHTSATGNHAHNVALSEARAAPGTPGASGKFNALEITVTKGTDTLELGFAVNKNAYKNFKKDGPGGTYGRFVLGLFPPGDPPPRPGDPDAWPEPPVYPYVHGALLR